VLGIVSVVFLIVALIIGVSITDHTAGHANSTPLISMLVALVPLTITSLLALLRTNDVKRNAEENKAVVESVKAVAEKTQKDLHNGVLTANMRQAIRAVAHEDSITVEATEHTPRGGTGPIEATEGDIPGAPGH